MKGNISPIPRRASAVPAEHLANSLVALAKLDGYSRYDYRRVLSAAVNGEQNREDMFLLVTQMLRGWAALDDVSGPDGYVVEAARKICDVMAWAPAKEAA